MDAKEFLKKQNITDVIINKSDLPEYWKSISDLIEEYQALQLQQTVVMRWFNISEKLPNELETVWLTNGKGWTCLGCLVVTDEGFHWAESNGVIYQENDKIVSECESEDLDVVYWHPLPKTIA